MTNVISFDSVSKRYPQGVTNALKNITLEILREEFFCLVGPSGCGKSTLLKLIAGIENPSSGEIDKPTQVSMVFQSGALLPWLTVEENVGFGLKMKGISSRVTAEVSAKYLDLVHLSDFAKKYPRELSGGQRQRVGIARALAMEPEVLLLDEPFSALDPFTTEELHRDLLNIWKTTKATVVMVSHLLEEALILADRVGVMGQGEIKDIIEVNLPRPRNAHSEEFLSLIERLRRILNQGEGHS